MLHPSTQQLIRKLCELTDAGQIPWKEGERQCSLFETEGYIVEVEAEPPTLRLLRTDGRELERATAAELGATAWPDGQGTFATHVGDLAAKAQRIARGAEQAIAKILSSLSAPPRKAPEPPARAPGAVESAAALAAVNADLASQRKQAPPLPPPAPAAQAEPAPPPAPAAAPAPIPAPSRALAAPDLRPASGGILFSGISARSTQTPESATLQDIARAAPTPAPAARPAPAGPSIYKPWAQ